MSKSVYSYQYEKPTMPVSWNVEERRFFNQLMSLFDRLFSMKLGMNRLKENELFKKLYPVGMVAKFHLDTDDPNELFPGRTWELLENTTYEWVRQE